MNLSISNTNALSRKHLKVTYIAAACVVALAAGAVVSNGVFQNRTNAGTGLGSPISATAATLLQQTRTYVYYLARNQQDAADFAGLLSSEGGAFGANENATVLVDSPESRNMVSLAQAELTSLGGGLRVIEPAAPANAAANTEATSPTDVAIMQGVISSERSTWAFDDASPAARTVTDADLMAGVLSSEHAAWAFPAADVAEASR